MFAISQVLLPFVSSWVGRWLVQAGRSKDCLNKQMGFFKATKRIGSRQFMQVAMLSCWVMFSIARTGKC